MYIKRDLQRECMYRHDDLIVVGGGDCGVCFVKMKGKEGFFFYFYLSFWVVFGCGF